MLTILSGMTYKEQLMENIATLSPLKPLTQQELDTLEEANYVLNELREAGAEAYIQ